MIAGLVLAAGRSARFGGDKLLAPLRGQPVLFWSAVTIAAEVDALYVVVPPEAPDRVAALGSLPAVIVEHAGRDAGMSSSIAAGVAALAPDVDAVVIALADQPLVAPDVVRRMCARWHEGGVAAVAPAYRDGRGHPVLFGRASFDALRALTGDGGARAVLDALGDTVAAIPVESMGPLDVDTPDALRRLAAAWSR
jgi:molybdenum cofactor cytidylyltransferase